MARLAKDLFDHDEGNVETQLLKSNYLPLLLEEYLTKASFLPCLSEFFIHICHHSQIIRCEVQKLGCIETCVALIKQFREEDLLSIQSEKNRISIRHLLCKEIFDYLLSFIRGPLSKSQILVVNSLNYFVNSIYVGDVECFVNDAFNAFSQHLSAYGDDFTIPCLEKSAKMLKIGIESNRMSEEQYTIRKYCFFLHSTGCEKLSCSERDSECRVCQLVSQKQFEDFTISFLGHYGEISNRTLKYFERDELHHATFDCILKNCISSIFALATQQVQIQKRENEKGKLIENTTFKHLRELLSTLAYSSKLNINKTKNFEALIELRKAFTAICNAIKYSSIVIQKNPRFMPHWKHWKHEKYSQIGCVVQRLRKRSNKKIRFFTKHGEHIEILPRPLVLTKSKVIESGRGDVGSDSVSAPRFDF
ncbi:unnamed protein product [Dracunculus medinensis]|uniref:Uncharacterized protein n=1 Tax=Dracunculus medinensis TaxID=318479 RepID=A0A0N4UJ44_DRAME|nr:unnamed protein product [Dracunculus medinensis]